MYISQQNGNLAIGNGAGQIAISVQGKASTENNYWGYGFYTNSSRVDISTGGNLSVDTTYMQLGDSPYVNLSAGGNLLITGNLIADGVSGAGVVLPNSSAGGTVILSCNSSSAFIIGGEPSMVSPAS